MKIMIKKIYKCYQNVIEKVYSEYTIKNMKTTSRTCIFKINGYVN